MKKYLHFALKRAFCLYPAILRISAITLAGILLAVALFANKIGMAEQTRKFRIGVVGDAAGSYLGVGISALRNIDSSRFAVELVEMEEADAVRALDAGEITGYLSLPEDFLEGIIYGKNHPARFVLLGGPEGFGTVLTGEVVAMVSDLVTESQRALYALQTLAEQTGETDEIGEKVEKLNIEFIRQVLGRDGAYTIEELGALDALSTGGYYFCAMYVLFLLLWGLFCIRLLHGQNMDFHRLLSARGWGSGVQVGSEYLSYTGITFLTLLLFSLPISLGLRGGIIRELADWGVFSAVGFVAGSLPVCLMLCAMHIFLYEITEGTVSAAMLQFIVALAMAYLCGCLYPLPFFPDSVQRIGGLLPAGMASAYLRQLLAGAVSPEMLGGMLLYTGAFSGLAVWMRKRKMAGDYR